MKEPDPVEVSVVEQSGTPSVAVRLQIPMSDLNIGAVFSEQMSRLTKQVAVSGGRPAGPPYARYHEFGPERVDIEIGIPVGAAIAGLPSVDQSQPGEIGVSELPGGQRAMTLHIGSYAELGSCYERLEGWMAEHGRTGQSGPWESYLVMHGEVDDDPARLRTEVCWPLA